MAISPEALKNQTGISERPVEVAVPEEVEKKDDPGIKATPSTFKAQVQDDQGNNLISTPETKTVSIELPKITSKLEELSKGSIDDSVTWFGRFWLRIVKKAVHFGWKIIQKH